MLQVVEGALDVKKHWAATCLIAWVHSSAATTSAMESVAAWCLRKPVSCSRMKSSSAVMASILRGTTPSSSLQPQEVRAMGQ